MCWWSPASSWRPAAAGLPRPLLPATEAAPAATEAATEAAPAATEEATEAAPAATEEATEAAAAATEEAPAAEATEAAATEEAAPSGEAVTAEPGQAVKMVLMPKFLGIAVFDEANTGAQEAAKELENPEELQFLGPTAENSVAGQIEIVTSATTQGVKAIMISNNAGDQIAPAAQAARDAGMTVVTWDSPIPSAEGEQVFVAQVDFDETGKVMADMARNILGEDGGKFAVLSASPDAANQNAWIAALQEALKDPAYCEPRAAGHRLRQRPVGRQLQPGAGPRGQVPGHGADHGPDLRRHRGGGQGHAGRGSV